MTALTFYAILFMLIISWRIGIKQRNPEKAGMIAINCGVFFTFLGIIGKASKLEKMADSLDALMLSVIEHNKELSAKKYRSALFKKEFV